MEAHTDRDVSISVLQRENVVILVLSFDVKAHMRLCHGNLGGNLLRSYIHPEIRIFCYLRKNILKCIFWINNVDESIGPERCFKNHCILFYLLPNKLEPKRV